MFFNHLYVLILCLSLCCCNGWNLRSFKLCDSPSFTAAMQLKLTGTMCLLKGQWRLSSSDNAGHFFFLFFFSFPFLSIKHPPKIPHGGLAGLTKTSETCSTARLKVQLGHDREMYIVNLNASTQLHLCSLMNTTDFSQLRTSKSLLW